MFPIEETPKDEEATTDTPSIGETVEEKPKTIMKPEEEKPEWQEAKLKPTKKPKQLPKQPKEEVEEVRLKPVKKPEEELEKIEVEEVQVTTIKQKYKERKPKQPDEEVEELPIEKLDEVFYYSYCAFNVRLTSDGD